MATYTSHKRSEADTILREIGTRYFQNRGTANIAELTKELIQLESEHRGEFASVMAIRKALDWSKGWPEPASTRPILLELLREHYIDHKDVDLCIDSLLNQSYDAEGLAVLQILQNKSSHRHVRAKACFLQINHLARQLELHQSLKERGWKLGHETPKGYTKEQKRQLLKRQNKLIDSIRSLDPATLRKQVEITSNTIRTKYPDVVRSSIISTIESFNFERHQRKNAQTYSKLIEPIFFKMNNLSIGMTIPEVIGHDVVGQPFKLSELRGKVVVLFFASNWHSARQKKFYAEFTNLKERHGNNSFEIVTVLTDKDEKHAKEPVEKGWITWPTLWDKGDRLVKCWHIHALPSDLFVIDDVGVIRHRLFGADDPLLQKILNSLIDEAKQREN